MLSSVNPEMMYSDSQLNWKIVTKGRRSVRSKSGEAVPTMAKTEHVPIKKRRLLFRPSSPQPQTPSLCRQDSSSPQQHSSSPPLEDNDQLSYQSLSSAHRSMKTYSNWQLRGIDRAAKISFGGEFGYELLSRQTEAHNYGEDFSGIELLAAAASMDVDSENASEEDEILKDSSVPKCSNASSTVAQSKFGSECYKSENAAVHEDVAGYSQVLSNISASQDLVSNVEDGTNPISNSSKVDRRHWDLNTVMDTWDEPYKISICGDTSKDVANVDISVDHLLFNSGSIEVGSSSLKSEENKLKSEVPQETFIKLPSLEDSLPEPNNNNYCKVASETSDQATDKVVERPASFEKMDSTASYEKMDSPVATEKIDSPVATEKIDSPVAAEKMDSLVASEKIESSSSVEKFDSIVDAPQDLDVCLDSRDCIIDIANLTSFQEGCDSPYEDGELRGSCLYSWEDNELDIECVDYESDGRNEDGSDAADLHGSEIVDGGSEGSHGNDGKSLMLKKFSGNSGDSRAMEHSSRRYFIKDESENYEISGKNESNEESVIGENEEGDKRILSEQIDAVEDKVARLDEYMLKTNRIKLQSCTKRSSLDATDGKNFLMQQCRSRPPGGSDSRSERDSYTNKYISRYRPHASERVGVDQWTSWRSRSHYSSTYHGGDDRSNIRIRSMTGDSRDKFSRLDFHDKRQTTNYSSKAYYGPSARRSPVDNEDCFGVYKRVPVTRCDGSYRRGNYSHIARREFEENFEPLNDDATTIVRMPSYPLKRERSFSPCSVRGDNMPLTHKRSLSRSRARSPIVWHARGDREVCDRRQIRSPGIKSDTRIDKMRAPFFKSTCASDYGDEGYMATPRGRSSPQRWIDNRNFEDSHLKRRRSPVRVFRRTQRFEAFTSHGRPKSDEYFRPTIRPRRFHYMSGHDRESKFETSYEDRKHDGRSDMLHRGRQHVGDGGNLRRLRHTTAADEFETNNLNNEDEEPQG